MSVKRESSMPREGAFFTRYVGESGMLSVMEPLPAKVRFMICHLFLELLN